MFYLCKLYLTQVYSTIIYFTHDWWEIKINNLFQKKNLKSYYFVDVAGSMLWIRYLLSLIFKKQKMSSFNLAAFIPLWARCIKLTAKTSYSADHCMQLTIPNIRMVRLPEDFPLKLVSSIETKLSLIICSIKANKWKYILLYDFISCPHNERP